MPVNRIGSKSDKYIQKLKQSRALKSRAKVVTIGETEISTVDEFIYLLYASEIWTLDIKTRRSIRSWYCRKMSLITERSYRDEYVSPTIDVIQLIRIRRAKWLKLNLTYNSKSLVVQVLRRQSLHNRTKGDVFSDVCLMCTSMHLKTNSTIV